MNHHKKIAIMQPYFFPYIGYFQLINYVDEFIIYDNIQYTKKGWINRNRYLSVNGPKYFSLPLRKSSDFDSVSKKYIADDYQPSKILNLIKGAYKKAPYFEETYAFFSDCLYYPNKNLFCFIFNSLNKILELLSIKTKIAISSTLNINNDFKGQEKVINICSDLSCTEYINPIGGIDLYSKNDFCKANIKLKFLSPNIKPYKQFNNNFVGALSILDVLMFNSIEEIKNALFDFDIV